MQLPEIALGAVIAALIAGMISIANLVGGKENKTSEFRQAWIDGLRKETAKLIGHALALDGMVGSRYRNREELWRDAREDAVGFAEASASIRMRLNPKEAPSKTILALLRDIEGLLAFDPGQPRAQLKPPASGAVGAKSQELAKAVGEVLKRDWRRVKRGEPVYLAVVGFAVLMIVLTVGILVVNTKERGAVGSAPAAPPTAGAGSSVGLSVQKGR